MTVTMSVGVAGARRVADRRALALAALARPGRRRRTPAMRHCARGRSTRTKAGRASSAAVLGPEDSLRMFGTDVIATGVQPVWIEVRNDTDAGAVAAALRDGSGLFLATRGGVVRRTSCLAARPTSGSTSISTGWRFRTRSRRTARAAESCSPIRSPSPSCSTWTCWATRRWCLSRCCCRCPVDAADLQDVVHRYEDAEITSYDDLEALRKALESLPCCAVDGGRPRRRRAAQRGVHRPSRRHRRPREAGVAIVAVQRRRACRQQVFGRPPDLYFRKRAQAGAPAIWAPGLACADQLSRAVRVRGAGGSAGRRAIPAGGLARRAAASRRRRGPQLPHP